MPVAAADLAQDQLATVPAQLVEVVKAAALHLALARAKEILLGQQQPNGSKGRGCRLRSQQFHQGLQGQGPCFALEEKPGGGQVLPAGGGRC